MSTTSVIISSSRNRCKYSIRPSGDKKSKFLEHLKIETEEALSEDCRPQAVPTDKPSQCTLQRCSSHPQKDSSIQRHRCLLHFPTQDEQWYLNHHHWNKMTKMKSFFFGLTGHLRMWHHHQMPRFHTKTTLLSKEKLKLPRKPFHVMGDKQSKPWTSASRPECSRGEPVLVGRALLFQNCLGTLQLERVLLVRDTLRG